MVFGFRDGNWSNVSITKEGATESEIQIIGIELAARIDAMAERELEMFSCKHTLSNHPSGRRDIRITLHTSQGDCTVNIHNFQPGNYYVA